MSRLLREKMLSWALGFSLALGGLLAAFADVTPRILSQSIGSQWSDTETAVARLSLALEHQNRLRQGASAKISVVRGGRVQLPELALRFKADAYAAPLKTIASERAKIWIEQGYPEMGSSGYFLIDGDLLIKSDYNDFWSLNFVYEFKERNLLKVKPFVVWKLAQEPGEELILYRTSSERERAVWRSGDLKALGEKSWGFGEADGKVQAAVHFAIRPWNGRYDVKIRIPKRLLLRDAEKRPTQIWGGSLDEGRAAFHEVQNFEVIVSSELLAQYYDHGDLKIEFAASGESELKD